MQESHLLKQTPAILEAIDAGGRATLIKLTGHLIAQGLITKAIKQQAKQAPTVLEGADMLMEAIQDKVKKNPAIFGKFLMALRSSDLNDEADMLESECCEFEIIFYALQKSPCSLLFILLLPTCMSVMVNNLYEWVGQRATHL